MSVSQAARAWQAAGVSTIPVLPNGTKRPATQWREFQGRIANIGEMQEWWGNGHEYGLALIMGKISGNMEMLEIEGRAMTDEYWPKVTAKMAELGLAQIFDDLMVDGYTEESPSGGLHLIYRITDHPVPGNEKIARRPSTQEELAANPFDKAKVLAETRGEGGYVIVAPSSGLCHPSGKQWVKIFGEYGVVADVTWEDRNAIHAAIREALDEMPDPVTPAPVPAKPSLPGQVIAGTGLRPGDDWAAQTSWESILESDGWTFSHRTGVEDYWVRPGKSRRDGHSATINYGGSNLLKVFSSSIEGLEQESTYSKLGYLAAVHYRGDHSAAASALAARGFGSQPDRIVPGDLILDVDSTTVEEKYYSLDDMGNGQRLWDRVSGQFHWVEQEKGYRYWDGKIWRRDQEGKLTQEWEKLTSSWYRSDDSELRKWAKTSRSYAKVQSVKNLMKDIPGCAKDSQDFDADLELLNVENGLLNLRTGEFGRHDPSKLITRTFGATFDPSATCPNFDRFMEQVLPDSDMRQYVQRALGYSLLGNSDQRSLFIIHGPSGTGKSTLMETMRTIFGEYGMTAPAGTFKAKMSAQGPNNDLHRLKGRRFVTTSETAESAIFDEDMIKRLTGRDRIQSRDMYEKFQEWTPECVVWMATNHPPRFTSDDNAIWKRVKLIPFLTQFEGENEIADLSRRLLVPEASGILNWLLKGLRDFLAEGLEVPEEVNEAAQQLRLQSDPVTRFVEEQMADGILVEAPEAKIKTVELHRMYLQWAKDTGEIRLGSRRFANRIESGVGLERIKSDGQRVWRGITRGPGVGVMGTIF